tara:strand:+ start:745 stop:1179 length:435 start_codon:yes stop_codon:yes gene_type:complete
MAYAITLNNNLLRIAANETEKNELTALLTPHTEINISDSDYLLIKQNIANFVIDGDTMTINEDSDATMDVDQLQEHLTSVKKSINLFKTNANANTQSKTLYTQFINYNNYLETFDIATVTFPIVSWEKYCQDNGITYLNLLQIP